MPGAIISGKATNRVTLIELSGRQKEDRRINFVADPIWEYTSTKTLNNPTAPGGNIFVDWRPIMMEFYTIACTGLSNAIFDIKIWMKNVQNEDF